MDLGASRRGVDMGPSAIRVTNLEARLEKLGIETVDKGDVDVPIPEECEIGDPHKKYADEIRKVCESLHQVAYQAVRDGRMAIVLGGDHSIAMGSIAGVAKHYREQKKKIGLVWIDAHGDMNTPTSTVTGNVHGMPLSHVLGMGAADLANIGGFMGKVDPRNTCLVGVRDLDEREKALISESGVHVFTMKEIDRYGIAKVMDEALGYLTDGTAGFHVSFDIDAVDPSIAPGVGTPKKGGLNYRESHLLMELIADTGKMTSLDMVEVNPIFDDRNTTAELASELILSAVGKTIF